MGIRVQFGRTRVWALWLLGLLPLVACTSSSPEPERATAAAIGSTPAWTGMPLSWAKLAEIEEWLAGPGPRHWPETVPQAKLELAEGRLVFARHAPDEATRRTRVAAAENGFQAVLAHPDAGSLDRRRARDGLRSAAALNKTPHVAVASTPSSPMKILPRSVWGAARAVPARMTPHRGAWTRITVHHSAKTRAEQVGGGSPSEVADALARIQRYHLETRSWGDIGYHFLIDGSGRVYAGRGLEWRGAHAQGKNNVGNIGVCLLGDFVRERPSAAALTSLDHLLGRLSTGHRIPRSKIFAHRELVPTECPGDSMMAWLERFRRGAAPTVQAQRTLQASARTNAPATVQ